MPATDKPTTDKPATDKPATDKTVRLLVNPVDCQGHGACAELLPEAITMDEWGYPVIDPGPLPPGLERDARAAVSACPTLAFHLTRA